MSDTKAIIKAARELRRAKEPFLVATVVRVAGSSYRRPGARMLLTSERWIAGSVSGGCLENDLVKKGWWHTRDGAAVVMRYDTRSSDEARWGFGLGCEGVVDVLLERAGEDDPVLFIDRSIEAQVRGVI